MRTVVFAYHEMGVVGLESLKSEGFDIRAVFSHRDDPREKIWFRSVARWARDHGIEVFSPDNVNDPDWAEKIAAMKPQILFSFYYRRLLGKEILSLPPSGAYNLHGSLLPAYRGRSPVNWVLELASPFTTWWRRPMPEISSLSWRFRSHSKTPPSPFIESSVPKQESFSTKPFLC